jgi:signal peptidase I
VRGPIDRATARLPGPWRTAADWLITIAVAVGAVLAIKAWVVNPYRIPSSSMEPTLHCAQPGMGCQADFSDRVLANRFIYHFKDPERGDIIVFEVPESGVAQCRLPGSETFVKRLVGLPGERIEGRQGRVFIDGRPLAEPYLDEISRDGIDPFPAQEIPDDHFFMMGDNRPQSCDSREWGPVPRSNIIGEVFSVYWPPQRIGFR